MKEGSMPRACQSAASPVAHRCAPAEWPSRLIRLGSPPYSAMCWLTHSMAASAESATRSSAELGQLVIDDDRSSAAPAGDGGAKNASAPIAPGPPGSLRAAVRAKVAQPAPALAKPASPE